MSIDKEFIVTDPESLLNKIVPPEGANMELEKAIKLCDTTAKHYDMMNMPTCAAEERQFAEWLRELQFYRTNSDNIMKRFSKEVGVMLKLQTRLEDLMRECSEKANAIGLEATEELEAISENWGK